MSGFGPLNLSDADTSGFEPLEPGRYNAVVHEIKMDAVKNAGGKTPVGTPIIKVQYALAGYEGDESKLNNRRAFQQFVIPPADYDQSKAARMKGMIVNFFVALGFPEDVVKSKKFDLEGAMDEAVGRECVIVLGKEPKKDRDGNVIPDEFNNPVKGVKPAGSLAGTGSSSSGLL